MTTAVVTDSTTSLAPGVLERPDVRMVPLTFNFGSDETYTDKVDMSNAEFYERLRSSDEFPTTAQPSPGAFVQTYEALSDYDDILVLTVSSGFSGTYNSAVQAAEMVDLESVKAVLPTEVGLVEFTPRTWNCTVGS